MQTIGSFAAKTHLSRLLRDVEQNNEEFVIHRHNHKIACLIPFSEFSNSGNAALNIVAEFKHIREKQHVRSISVKNLVTEGRKR